MGCGDLKNAKYISRERLIKLAQDPCPVCGKFDKIGCITVVFGICCDVHCERCDHTYRRFVMASTSSQTYLVRTATTNVEVQL